jgi:predicted PurR-regulated permease PerM
MAIYLAAQPDMYRRGVALLFPQRLRPKAMEALNLIGSSLRLWMLAQLILMAVVGLLSYVVVLVLGLPNPGALGLIAGITELVPYLGPFNGGAPAVLVALTKNTTLAVYTILDYIGVHVVEGYLIGPLLQRWFVLIPPALVLTGIFASQLLFGFAGIILAAPITVAVFAAVKVLYMRDTLKQDVEMPENPPI